MGVLVLVDPVVGTTTDATLIAANDAAIKAVVNGGIDASNFGAGKIFAPNKIQQAGALVGQALVWNGTDWAPAASQRKTTAKIVNTTVAATDLLNGEFTIAAGAMGTTGMLRLTAEGDWLNNSGGAVAPPRFQIVLGGTTLLDVGTSGTATQTANRNSWRIVVEIANLGAANSQSAHIALRMMSNLQVTQTQNLFTTGTGILTSFTASGQVIFGEGINLSAIDTTLAKLLELKVINGSASASYETKLFNALVEAL